MLWHYGDADPEFGALQAKRLQDELADVLCGGSRASTITVGGVLGGGTVEGTSGARGLTKSPFCCESSVRSSLSLGGGTIDSIQAGSEAGLIDITHEEGVNRDVGGTGAYLEVTAFFFLCVLMCVFATASRPLWGCVGLAALRNRVMQRRGKIDHHHHHRN